MCTRSSRGPPSLDGFGWAMCVIKTIVCYTALEVQIWKIICNDSLSNLANSPERKFRSNGIPFVRTKGNSISPFLNFVETGDNITREPPDLQFKLF